MSKHDEEDDLDWNDALAAAADAESTTFTQNAAKAKSWDHVVSELGKAGFDTSGETLDQTARTILSLSLNDGLGLVQAKLRSLATAVGMVQKMCQQASIKLDNLNDYAGVVGDSLRDVKGECETVDELVRDRLYGIVDARMKMHENQYHGTKFRIREDVEDLNYTGMSRSHLETYKDEWEDADAED